MKTVLRGVLVLLACLPAAALAATECVRDFEAFIERFALSREFQRAQSVYPLAVSTFDGRVDPAARTRMRNLTRAQAATLDELDFPSPATRQAQGLVQARMCTHPSACVIAFDKADSDKMSIRFSFAQRRGCWRLVGISSITL